MICFRTLGISTCFCVVGGKNVSCMVCTEKELLPILTSSHLFDINDSLTEKLAFNKTAIVHSKRRKKQKRTVNEQLNMKRRTFQQTLPQCLLHTRTYMYFPQKTECIGICFICNFCFGLLFIPFYCKYWTIGKPVYKQNLLIKKKGLSFFPPKMPHWWISHILGHLFNIVIIIVVKGQSYQLNKLILGQREYFLMHEISHFRIYEQNKKYKYQICRDEQFTF